MVEPLDLRSDTDITAVGVATFAPKGISGTIKKLPTRGHHLLTLTSKSKTAGGAPNATVKLKGTNNPDPADTTGETLITNTHGAANQQDGSGSSKGYKYVFVHVDALTDLEIDWVHVYGTGFSGS